MFCLPPRLTDLGGSRAWGETRGTGTRPDRSLPTHDRHRAVLPVTSRVSHARSPCAATPRTVFREHFPAKTAPSDRCRRIIRQRTRTEAFGFRFGNVLRPLSLPPLKTTRASQKASPSVIRRTRYAAFSFTVKSTSKSALPSKFTSASRENLSILPLSSSLKRG